MDKYHNKTFTISKDDHREKCIMEKNKHTQQQIEMNSLFYC